MINTVDIKRARDEVFTLHSNGKPEEVILIVGSCRCVAYLNYLHRYNESAGRPLRIHFIEPNDYCIGFNGDALSDLPKAETNPAVIGAIRSATVFVHEWYAGYGLFNTDRAQFKNIYNFGMRAPIDITIPNFHDKFILFSEQLQLRKNELLGYSKEQVISDMTAYGLRAVNQFLNVCAKSSLPDFGNEFWRYWIQRRYFWTGNHISRHFHLSIFRRINDEFLHLPLDDSFWHGAATEDLFSNTPARVTQEDVDAYGLTWSTEDTGPILPLTI